MRRRLSSYALVGGLALALAWIWNVPEGAQAAQAAPERAVLAGTVRDGQGQPLPGAQVEVSGPGVQRATHSDAQGRYRFEGLPPGTYTLSATLAGFARNQVRLELHAGQTQTHDLVLRPAVLEEAIQNDYDVMPAKNKVMPARTREEQLKSFGYVAGGVAGAVVGGLPGYAPPFNTESYAHIQESGFRQVADDPLSTFSIDVDSASYSNVRRFLKSGQLPPPDAVRVEELINYFAYDYPQPEGDEPFSVSTEVAACPWNPAHHLVQIGLQGQRIPDDKLPPRNLVFLIDVSGSMQSPNKLPLLKTGLALLIRNLNARDRLAIAVYAGSSGLVLPSTPGDDTPTLQAALAGLQAGGSTNAGAGIELAYRVAEENFIEGGVNRVLLATDGDFNVGVTNQGDLVRLIEEKRRSGVFLSVLGFGQGNLKDSTMELLSKHGNGNYAYIDDLAEARKVLVAEAAGTLVTLAKDVKIQVEFNPARVASYRLIGYENRRLNNEDFADDTKDAGEIGAGHTVTALYEIVPRKGNHAQGAGLRYQKPQPLSAAADSDELLRVQLRFKAPDGDRSRLLTELVHAPRGDQAMSAELGFASAVAAFGMLLRDSEHKGQADFDLALDLARRNRGDDAHGHRAELMRLVELARDLRAVQKGRNDVPKVN